MKLKTMCAAVAASVLGGCVSILPDPPPAPYVYTMRVGAVEKTQGPAKPLVITVGAPSMPRMSAGADIVWREGAEIAVMEGAAWDDATPDLLQTMLAETMDRRGALKAAVRSGAGVRGDVDLRWDVLAFEIVEDRGLKAVLSTTVRLIDSRSRAIIETRRFDVEAPVSERRGRAATAALEKAARDACLLITDWAAERAPVPAPPPVVSGQSSEVPPSQPSAASTRR